MRKLRMEVDPSLSSSRLSLSLISFFTPLNAGVDKRENNGRGSRRNVFYKTAVFD
jgi:hypothetical protein